MFDGKQVLTITNKIKFSDIGGLSKELLMRKGTGNYDINRTKYNIEFIPLCSTNLASSTYKTLYKNNVEFNKNNKNINLLNGCIITSGQEFFKSLGMKFEDTGRKYLTGEHKGEPINKVVINNPNDIPEQVLNYFKCSHEFLSNLVGKENVVYSAIHFDEDTPHMHFYFTPVVNEVHRKIFETDSNGHQVLKSYIGKDGKEKLIPIQKKDENGKNLYSIEKGKFLNCDQFWKDKDFKTSFAKIQDDYNKFITSKGFNLGRGQIGGNKYHQTKTEKYLEELQEENKLMELELKKNKVLNEVEISYKEKISNVDTYPLLNPEKGKIIGYKEKDKIIENQNLIIKEKDETIKYQNNIIESLKEELTSIKEMASFLIQNIKGIATDLYKALKRTLGLNVDKNQEYDSYEFKNLSKKINKKYEKNKSDDFEL